MHTHPLTNLVNMYLSNKDLTKGSLELYKLILDQYVSYLNETNILYATKADILKWLELSKSKGLSTRWVNHQINALKGFYRYLKDNQERMNLPDVYAYDIMETIKSASLRHETSKPTLSIEEAKHLILYTQQNQKTISQIRDHAIIYLMMTSGLRSIEIRRAKRADLKSIQGQQVLYIQGKGKQAADEYVKVSKGALVALNKYLALRQDKNPYLFISHSRNKGTLNLCRSHIIKMFKKVLIDSGLAYTKTTAHTLRHTAATINLKRGASLEATKQFLRHTHVNATLIYAHHIDRAENDSEAAIERFLLEEKT